jgi:hypothetical protein
MVIKFFARYVHAKQTLIGVDLSMELEHLLHVFSVDNEITALSVEELRDSKR